MQRVYVCVCVSVFSSFIYLSLSWNIAHLGLLSLSLSWLLVPLPDVWILVIIPKEIQPLTLSLVCVLSCLCFSLLSL